MFDEINEKTARENDVSVDTTMNEIKKAISADFNNDDPAIRAKWKEQGFEEEPTPEEFVTYLAIFLSIR